MKNFFKTLSSFVLCCLFILVFTYKQDIVEFVMKNYNQQAVVSLPNEKHYHNDYNFMFVNETDDFHVKSRQDILNVIYTFLNNGLDEFTFYCDKDYKNCQKDFENISHDKFLLSVINNLVSPYNSYEKIYFTYNNFGEIKIKIDKLYSREDISKVESIINEFITNNVKDNMTLRDKIKVFHDYIINTSSYDKERATKIEENKDDDISNQSHKATGPLINKMALCSGYSDAMKIYLDKLNIPNYKVSNSNHIWNLVYLDGKWLHLDITWDDPVTNTGANLLLHKFFLISTDDLMKLDSSSHDYNDNYYLEIKK